jgi:hypothetical protein
VVRNADGGVTPRVRVSWTAVTDSNVLDGGLIEVLWRRNALTTYQRVRAQGRDTQLFINSLKEGDRIVLRASAVNKYGARSAPVIVAHTVSGKSTAPSNVANLAGSVGLTAANGSTPIVWRWSIVTDPDYAETELRTGGTNWATSTYLAKVKGSGYTQTVTADGTYNLRARNRDTSGNLSTATATATAVVDTAGSGDQDANFTAYRYSPTSAAVTVGLRFQNSGQVQRDQTGSYVNLGLWYSPLGTPGNSRWIRFTTSTQSGGTLTGSATGWLALTSDRTVTLAITGGGGYAYARVNYEISSSSGGSPVVASGYLDLISESDGGGGGDPWP